MINVYHAPADSNIARVFLAGSIEMGQAELWQDKVIKYLQFHKYNGVNIEIMNPRRDDWDSSWEQSIENKKFVEQVNWELDYLERSDLILFYFDPNTKSPISLMELGLVAHYGGNRVFVVCPNGFWRKGNVDILCDRYGINVYENLDSALEDCNYSFNKWVDTIVPK